MEDPHETLFSGPAFEAQEESARSGWFIALTDDGDREDVPPDVPPTVVRHARGYAPFVARVEALGSDPATLVRDLPALLAFLREHPTLLDDAAVVRAAAVFFGNALIVAHPAAAWHRGQEGEVGTEARSIVVEQALRHLVEGPERGRDLQAMLDGWSDADAQHALTRAAPSAATDEADGFAPVLPRRPFVRPPIPTTMLFDEAGMPISYGDRWDGPPPDEAYRTVSHPERFAPLHDVAEALIAHLAAEYAVTATAERNAQHDRIVRLVPEQGAPVTVRFSAVPGVEVRAGALFSAMVPSCGCDACDDSFESMVEAMESALLGVASGGLTERYPVGPRGEQVVGLRWADGASGSSGVPHDEPSIEARAALAALPNGCWPAWPLRRS